MKTYKVHAWVAKKWCPQFLYHRKYFILVDAENAYEVLKIVNLRQVGKYEKLLWKDINILEEPILKTKK